MDSDDRPTDLGAKLEPIPKDSSRATMELLFITAFGIVAVAALIAALTYEFHSAQAPLCTIVPMLLLIGIQFNRARKAVDWVTVRSDVGGALRGQRADATAVMRLVGWMLFLLLSIYILGHYAGMLVFMFILLRWVAKEKLTLSLIISLSVTGVVYLLFAHLFNIELYRGVIANLLGE